MASSRLNPHAPPYHPLSRETTSVFRSTLNPNSLPYHPTIPNPTLVSPSSLNHDAPPYRRIADSLPPPQPEPSDPLPARSPVSLAGVVPDASEPPPQPERPQPSDLPECVPVSLGGTNGPSPQPVSSGQRSNKVKRRNRRGQTAKHGVKPFKKGDRNTTIMIKNIPYDCSRKELMKVLNVFCACENSKSQIEGTSEAAAQPSTSIDFVYLPFDFRTNQSRGYAFVNFTNAGAAWNFFEVFHLRTHWDITSPRKIEVVLAETQGKEALVKKFSDTIFECETDKYLPVVLNPPMNGTGQYGEVTVGRQ